MCSINSAYRAMKSKNYSDKENLIEHLNKMGGSFNDKLTYCLRQIPNTTIETASSWIINNTKFRK